jgi:hypothetical protein
MPEAEFTYLNQQLSSIFEHQKVQISNDKSSKSHES